MKFSIPITPRFNEIDMYGQLHHSVYFWWFEVARIAYLNSLGVDLDPLFAEGYHFVLTRSEARYKKAARSGMQLRVSCEAVGNNSTKLTLRQTVFSAMSHECFVEATIELVAVKDSALLLRLPDCIPAALKRRQTNGNTNTQYSP